MRICAIWHQAQLLSRVGPTGHWPLASRKFKFQGCSFVSPVFKAFKEETYTNSVCHQAPSHDSVLFTLLTPTSSFSTPTLGQWRNTFWQHQNHAVGTFQQQPLQVRCLFLRCGRISVTDLNFINLHFPTHSISLSLFLSLSKTRTHTLEQEEGREQRIARQTFCVSFLLLPCSSSSLCTSPRNCGFHV